MNEIAGKVVVVTGAARGLGAGMARGLVAHGARVALLDRDAEPLRETVADCGPSARGWAVDVTDVASLSRVAGEVVEHFGGVDVLVVNAGVGAGGAFATAEPDAWDRVVEINLLGSIRTTRAFLPHVVERRGHILQIASVAAMAPAPMMSAYCTSKSGVEAFAHCLRGELARDGVTVGVAYLGFTDTDMVRQVDADPVLGGLRAAMPWPFHLTHPAAPAVARLVRGIEKRQAHVYGQRWVRGLVWVRGALPSLTARGAGRVASSLEER